MNGQQCFLHRFGWGGLKIETAASQYGLAHLLDHWSSSKYTEKAVCKDRIQIGYKGVIFHKQTKIQSRLQIETAASQPIWPCTLAGILNNEILIGYPTHSTEVLFSLTDKDQVQIETGAANQLIWSCWTANRLPCNIS